MRQQGLGRVDWVKEDGDKPAAQAEKETKERKKKVITIKKIK